MYYNNYTYPNYPQKTHQLFLKDFWKSESILTVDFADTSKIKDKNSNKASDIGYFLEL